MEVLERFLKYVRIFSESDDYSDSTPSTPGQFDMAKAVAQDMKDVGIEDVVVDDKCYVYGKVSASEGFENEKVVGLIAHLDTAPAFSGKDVKPRIVENYDGKDIVLNEEKNIVIKTEVFPEIMNYKGLNLVVTDGNTLLGADDKAGVAEIITAAARIIEENIPHPEIRIAFTPDEETGRGADYFDVKGFGADYAYTVDGGALGELEYENFNAASAIVKVNGNCIHPGEGKNKMKNAILIAMEFNSMLPAVETPSHTEGYEGFFHVLDIKGSEELTTLEYIVRDHDAVLFSEKKKFMERIAEFLNEKYGSGTIELSLKDSYYNMKEKILPHMKIVEKAQKAFMCNDVTPKVVPIRGGTDGARLSYMGLPCPNLSTGGHNFHGKYEYIPVESMKKMTDVLVTLLTNE